MPSRGPTPCLKLQSAWRIPLLIPGYALQHLLLRDGCFTTSKLCVLDPEILTDCNLRQGARPLEGTYIPNILCIFFDFSGPYGPVWAQPGPLKSRKSSEKSILFYVTHVYQKSSFLTSILRFFIVLTCSSDFWPK